METQSALDILREYDTRCRKHASDLPSPVEIKEEWLGVGFRMGGKNFVTSLVEVAEILYFPSISKVPGTKPWVCGVANVRGNLLPVLDLQGFLGTPSAGLREPLHEVLPTRVESVGRCSTESVRWLHRNRTAHK